VVVVSETSVTGAVSRLSVVVIDFEVVVVVVASRLDAVVVSRSRVVEISGVLVVVGLGIFRGHGFCGRDLRLVRRSGDSSSRDLKWLTLYGYPW